MNPEDYVVTCPHCGANPTPYRPVGDRKVAAGRGGTRRHWQLAVCPACGGAAAFESDSSNRFVRVVPAAAPDEWSVDHLEGSIARDWGEAVRVYRVEAFEAAVVMCGRTLEAAAEQLGIEGRNLQSRIKKMIADDLITAGFADAMDYVRLIRNVGAHAGQPVSRESAEGTMRFTQQALRLLFEVPGELDRLTGTPPELAEGDDAASEGSA